MFTGMLIPRNHHEGHMGRFSMLDAVIYQSALGNQLTQYFHYNDSRKFKCFPEKYKESVSMQKCIPFEVKVLFEFEFECLITMLRSRFSIQRICEFCVIIRHLSYLLEKCFPSCTSEIVFSFINPQITEN